MCSCIIEIWHASLNDYDIFYQGGGGFFVWLVEATIGIVLKRFAFYQMDWTCLNQKRGLFVAFSMFMNK